MLISLLALTSFNSCTKKGEDDPGLSLKSRKARLAGVWALESGTETIIVNGDTVTAVFSGNTITLTDGGQTITASYSDKSEFTKDHIFTRTVIVDGNAVINEGYWAFMDGYDELKDKECVVLRIMKTTDLQGVVTYSGDEMPSEILRFRKLSSKEAIVDSEGTVAGVGTIYTTTSTKTYSKK